MPSVSATVDVDRLRQTLRDLPQMAERWTRASHRKAWLRFRDGDGSTGSIGLPERFRLAASAGNNPVPGGRYDFSLRRRQVVMPKRSEAQLRRGAAGPFQVSGAMKTELMQRKLRTRRAGSDLRSEVTINHRSINFWGNKRGWSRVAAVREQVAYLMTVYQDSVARTGMYTMTVLRSIKKLQGTPAAANYRQEWELRDSEIAQIRAWADSNLRHIVRTAAFTKAGTLRAKFQPRAAEVA